MVDLYIATIIMYSHFDYCVIITLIEKNFLCLSARAVIKLKNMHTFRATIVTTHIMQQKLSPTVSFC